MERGRGRGENKTTKSDQSDEEQKEQRKKIFLEGVQVK